ncbi:hypothetical protein ASG69_04390 [Rhodococcus sp. Leaf225]|nr:hypothetical protein ASG69_04390 [Rhodococcus sp. Leaf225]KQU44793.1 hypothetical protein ASH03_12750 [Rhodococcus sp. Leaf258]
MGTWGRISRTQVAPGRWFADTRYRGHDGVTRRVRRYTPEGAADRTGAAAERALIEALTEMSATVGGGDLRADSTVTALWAQYRAELVAKDRAPRTLDRYADVAAYITAGMGGLRLREVSTQRVEALIREVEREHGSANAKTTRSVLSGMWSMACRLGAAPSNPVSDTQQPTTTTKKKQSLSTEQLRRVLEDVRTSEVPCPPVVRGEQQEARYEVPTLAQYCARADLVDIVTMFSATGVRMSELLGIEWAGVDFTERVVRIDGKVVRHRGVGLVRVARDDDPKNTKRTLALPDYAITMLRSRKLSQVPNPRGLVFASSAGTLRDPDALNKQWRRVRTALGLDWVTGHTFRRTVASVLDEEKLSARVTADQLGHSRPSETMDRYMARGTVRHEVAAILDAAVKVESKWRVGDPDGDADAV